MKHFVWVMLIAFSFESKAQNSCDCCNLYLLTNYRAWESYFAPTEMKKSNYSIVNVDYSFEDSSGNAQTKPLAVFTFNRRGYIDELKEYYDGIPNHMVNFERRFNKRIRSTTLSYLDHDGDFLTYANDLYTEYTYSKNGEKTRQRSAQGEFLDDSLQSYQVVKYNSDGLQVKSFAQYHFQNGIEPDYHSEIYSELLFDKSAQLATRNTFIDDTLWTKETVFLTPFGKEKETQLISTKTGSEVIQFKYFEYNSDRQLIHMKSVIPITTEVFTECQDLGNFDLYFNYENGLLQSVNYLYAESELNVIFTYQ